MADEREDEKGEGQEKQSIGGQQSHESEYGQQGDQTSGAEGQPIGGNDNETDSGTPLSQGAEPPRSMGTRGDEFGQMSDPDRSGQQGEGFILQQGQGEDEGPSSAKVTDGRDFAEQGRGATEDEEDEEGAGPKDVGSGGPGSSV